jgi:hypothetical protein
MYSTAVASPTPHANAFIQPLLEAPQTIQIPSGLLALNADAALQQQLHPAPVSQISDGWQLYRCRVARPQVRAKSKFRTNAPIVSLNSCY